MKRQFLLWLSLFLSGCAPQEPTVLDSKERIKDTEESKMEQEEFLDSNTELPDEPL